MKLQINIKGHGKLKGEFNELQSSKSKLQLLIYAFLVQGDKAAYNKFIVIEFKCRSFEEAGLLVAHPTMELRLLLPENLNRDK